jgi:hypothetical protein
LDNQTVKCWGFNGAGQSDGFGELGLGDTNDRGALPSQMGDNLPSVNLGSGVIPQLLSVGNEHSCIVSTAGQTKCWGRNFNGELGLGNTINYGSAANQMGANLPVVNF